MQHPDPAWPADDDMHMYTVDGSPRVKGELGVWTNLKHMEDKSTRTIITDSDKMESTVCQTGIL